MDLPISISARSSEAMSFSLEGQMSRQLKILDFDCEALPGHWIGGDYVSKIITAVAFAWRHIPDQVSYMTHYQYSPSEMSVTLADELRAADIVTGHYIRGFDLTLVNGMLLRAGEGPLPKLTTVDTKLDLNKAHGRSLSQKNLASLVGVNLPKIDVTLTEWEGFNLREPGFEEAGVKRVTGDVKQHLELYDRLIDMGWVTTPSTWSPESKGTAYRS
jgi:hypothetical protein